MDRGTCATGAAVGRRRAHTTGGGSAGRGAVATRQMARVRGGREREGPGCSGQFNKRGAAPPQQIVRRRPRAVRDGAESPPSRRGGTPNRRYRTDSWRLVGCGDEQL